MYQGMGFYIILLILVSFFIYCFYYKKKTSYWKELGVRGPNPIPFFGNDITTFIGKTHPSELTKYYYDKFKDQKIVGINVNNRPALIVKDENLIKDILRKHSSVFSDRGINVDQSNELLHSHLFNLSKTNYKELKLSVSPAFSKSNLKNNLPKIADTIYEFLSYFDKIVSNTNPVDIYPSMFNLTTEITAIYGFSTKINNHNNPITYSNSNSKINSLSKYLTQYLREYHAPNQTIWNFVLQCITKLTSSNTKSKKVFYTKFMEDIVHSRSKFPGHQRDYIGRVIDFVNGAGYTATAKTNILASQANLFFSVGSKGIAISISNALYEIANNYSIQSKLRSEIIETCQIIDNKIVYFDDIKKMKYLDNIFKETLRKYPLRDIIRACNADYTFKDINITIPKNTRVIIPHYGLQSDSEIFSNPNNFEPERFDSKKYGMYFIPFGDGPRKCIGGLFTEYIFKIVLIKIVLNYKIFNVNMDRKNDPWKIFLFPKAGIHLIFEKYNPHVV